MTSRAKKIIGDVNEDKKRNLSVLVQKIVSKEGSPEFQLSLNVAGAGSIDVKLTDNQIDQIRKILFQTQSKGVRSSATLRNVLSVQ